ncbi:bifunctional glutamate N-acetyltransferase/amino-acid acetyltransferase ArgJ [Futiania mangrovi]|uniref:Arginine biosynthesis bifunctional protein ArgJ n=1 Tax=Futiania mangrovi TaxID=2959716 RepID=A0A9J6PC75_9PROT|nr:bifunctional glutamate N-acetyltransferase/amino-acid acetyltransferase ArgJ [Futiania mangrovii]MCP1336145.1 bifunctional glutamate N-acetyltransferase/amino-acid acetyltransferase ArgJ [Futiania mangrovii]
MPPVKGVRMAAARAGVRYKDRTDLLLMTFEPGTTAAGVLTKSKCASAPVDWCREALPHGAARACIVNSGNANAFTGKAGKDAIDKVAAALQDKLSCQAHDLYMASTGVIGEPLPPAPILAQIDTIVAAQDADAWEAAAAAIMTTDTFPKGATRTAKIDDATVTINGIAKGSGMIAPDMATMLAFVATDASIPPDVLQTLLMMSVRDSFNAITVDGDTSTSDTVLMFATGRGEKHEAVRRAADPRLKDFREALDAVMLDLAHQIVRDGEGATKFVAITVKGAETAHAARRIAMSIANSPLVKTAIAGEDPNWGRIVMAVGKAGEAADRDRIAVRIAGYPVAKNGEVDPAYNEPVVARAMRRTEIEIEVDVGVGRARSTVWTCDLTHAYIDINADYRS